jgi:hypothetical protein
MAGETAKKPLGGIGSTTSDPEQILINMRAILENKLKHVEIKNELYRFNLDKANYVNIRYEDGDYIATIAYDIVYIQVKFDAKLTPYEVEEYEPE